MTGTAREEWALAAGGAVVQDAGGVEGVGVPVAGTGPADVADKADADADRCEIKPTLKKTTADKPDAEKPDATASRR